MPNNVRIEIILFFFLGQLMCSSVNSKVTVSMPVTVHPVSGMVNRTG